MFYISSEVYTNPNCLALPSTQLAVIPSNPQTNSSCPFKKCRFHTKDRDLFLHHIGGEVRDPMHLPGYTNPISLALPSTQLAVFPSNP